MRIPRWAWVIAGLAAGFGLLVTVLERDHPESDSIEKIGRTEIAKATGEPVAEIDCERRLHIRSDIKLPCTVTLEDGTTFKTVADVEAHYRHHFQYSYTSTFSPVPRARGQAPAPRSTPSSQSLSDAQRLADCVREAGTDPSEIRACTDSR